MFTKTEKSDPIAGLSAFRLTDAEWLALDRTYGKLCKFASWQLLRNNARTSHTDDLEDIDQELKKAVIIAAMYFKRQVYIEACLEVVIQQTRDPFTLAVVAELLALWGRKTKHGANRQTFGPSQQKLLNKLLEGIPASLRPDIRAPLQMDAKFGRYCKAIAWNRKKTMAMKISKEYSIRSGIVSLSQYDFVSGYEEESA